MKKKVIFHSGSLRMGGLERILVEVLQNIDLNKFDIKLLIEDEFKEENIFEKDIPNEIKITYLIPEKVLQKTKKLREDKKNIISKIGYNFMMRVERYIRNKNLMLFIKNNEAEVLIDFDNGLSKDIHKIKKMKKIAWLHNSIPKLKKKKSKIERFGKRLNNYDVIVAICDDMKVETEKIFPYLKGRVERIYNPFNFERIKKFSNDDSDLSKEEKKMLKENYIVSVSRLDNVQKDYPTLLKAFKKLKKDELKEKLYIVGDGPSREEIEKQVREFKLEEEVKFLGQQKNPYIWMKNANLFVHSSKYEGLPTVLIEAMILNTVIVSSDCPTGPREILDNGQSGILVEVGDIEDLAKGILKGLNKKEKYSESSKIRVEEFNKVRVIEEYEKIIIGAKND
jgi:hypothetical protein